MDSLYLVVLFIVLTEIHGDVCLKSGNSKKQSRCLYKKYHEERSCIEIIKMIITNACCESSTDECLLDQCKASTAIRSCAKDLCRKSLASCIESVHKKRAQKRGKKGGVGLTKDGRSNDQNRNKDKKKKSVHKKRAQKRGKKGGVGLTKDGRNNDQNRNKDKKKSIFKLRAIVGISVGITGTLILFLIILAIIVICRRRSKKNKRKQQKRLQSLDKRLEMANLESSPSSTNKELYNIRNTDKSVNTYEAQTRCSGAEGDENVYYEIDEDKIESLTDIDGVHQKQLKEVRDKGSYYSDQTGYETQLGCNTTNSGPARKHLIKTEGMSETRCSFLNVSRQTHNQPSLLIHWFLSICILTRFFWFIYFP